MLCLLQAVVVPTSKLSISIPILAQKFHVLALAFFIYRRRSCKFVT